MKKDGARARVCVYSQQNMNNPIDRFKTRNSCRVYRYAFNYLYGNIIIIIPLRVSDRRVREKEKCILCTS